MDLLKVDYDKCIKCGICVEACPSCILSMGELGPECNFDRGCMSCGHCVAICPTAAMDNKYVPLEEQLPLPMPVLDAETAYNFLRMRRSVRMFKPQPPTVDQETLRSETILPRFLYYRFQSAHFSLDSPANSNYVQHLYRATYQGNTFHRND